MSNEASCLIIASDLLLRAADTVESRMSAEDFGVFIAEAEKVFAEDGPFTKGIFSDGISKGTTLLIAKSLVQQLANMEPTTARTMVYGPAKIAFDILGAIHKIAVEANKDSLEKTKEECNRIVDALPKDISYMAMVNLAIVLVGRISQLQLEKIEELEKEAEKEA